jgi:hypothetical protein
MIGDRGIQEDLNQIEVLHWPSLQYSVIDQSGKVGI